MYCAVVLISSTWRVLLLGLRRSFTLHYSVTRGLPACLSAYKYTSSSSPFEATLLYAGGNLVGGCLGSAGEGTVYLYKTERDVPYQR